MSLVFMTSDVMKTNADLTTSKPLRVDLHWRLVTREVRWSVVYEYEDVQECELSCYVAL